MPRLTGELLKESILESYHVADELRELRREKGERQKEVKPTSKYLIK